MSRLLEEGDVIELKEGHDVYAPVPKHFLYTNHRGDFTLDRGHVRIEGELSYIAGKYIVTHTALEGGSSGRDAYPDGHCVYCVKATDPEFKVRFYQSGCFTAMIEDIEPIGKAKLKWAIDS